MLQEKDLTGNFSTMVRTIVLNGTKMEVKLDFDRIGNEEMAIFYYLD